MTVLVLENLGAMQAPIYVLRSQLSRLARAVDQLVRARAARAVPEWRMRQVRNDVDRYLGKSPANRRLPARGR
jgi:hypothetical protein